MNNLSEAKFVQNPYKLPTIFHAEVQWPPFIEYDGMTYYRSGTVGNNIKTGIPSAEYRSYSDGVDVRVWMNANNEIAPE